MKIELQDKIRLILINYKPVKYQILIILSNNIQNVIESLELKKIVEVDGHSPH